MAKGLDAEKLIEELRQEQAKIDRRIAELEGKAEGAPVGEIAGIAIELSSLRAALPRIEGRLREAEGKRKAEHEAADAAAVERLRPAERKAAEAVVAKTEELAAALQDLGAVEGEIKAHRGWVMAQIPLTLARAVRSVMDDWRTFGYYHGDRKIEMGTEPNTAKLPKERRRTGDTESRWRNADGTAIGQ